MVKKRITSKQFEQLANSKDYAPPAGQSEDELERTFWCRVALAEPRLTPAGARCSSTRSCMAPM